MREFENKLTFADNDFYYIDIKKVFENYPKLKKLPFIHKILLENCLRQVSSDKVKKIIDIFIDKNKTAQLKIKPNRLITQDLSGTSLLIEFASIRDFLKRSGKDEKALKSNITVDLVVDHSLDIKSTSTHHSVNTNIKNEFDENEDRYRFLKWVNSQFENINIVPSGFGISHQVNLEFLSTMITIENIDDKNYLIPEFLIGTDLHSCMVNAMGIFSLNVSEIDALSCMLDSNLKINLPSVLGIELVGNKNEYINAYDIALCFTSFIKEKNLDYEYLEFFGEGVKNLSLENRATISNLAPEFGFKSAYFAVDENSIDYAQKTRDVDASLIKEYYKRQDLFFQVDKEIEYDEVLTFDLSLIKSIISGPQNPFTKVPLEKVASKMQSFKRGNTLRDNDIVLASITSCVSSSNPFLIVQAALLAKNAQEKGLDINPNIKTSFSLGSKVVQKYLEDLGLLQYLENLGFGVSGFGCAVCYGNSGDLYFNVENEIKNYNLNVSSISSGNRNFEGFIHPLIKSNWLMSPALVVAYSLKGSVNFNIKNDAINKGVYLKDIWPSDDEVNSYVKSINYKEFARAYNLLFNGDSHWLELEVNESSCYDWESNSIFVQPSAVIEDIYLTKTNINNGKIVAILGDDVKTSDILNFDNIDSDSMLAKYLESLNKNIEKYNEFEKRKVNNIILMKSMFDTNSFENKIVNKPGAYTKDFEIQENVSIEEFIFKYFQRNASFVLFAGKNLGFGKFASSVSKGLKLIGIKAIIAESFDENFRKNLIYEGILPLKLENQSLDSLNLDGSEFVNVFLDTISINDKLQIEVIQNNIVKKVMIKPLFYTPKEIIYYKNGGIISYLVKNIV